MRRKFIIEYDNDEPLLPNEHLYFRTYPQHHATNIKTLKGLLKIVTADLVFEPIINQQKDKSNLNA